MAQSAMAKGWRFHGQGGTLARLLRCEEFPRPRPPAHAVVRMQLAPVTQGDLDRIRGFCGAVTPLPALGGSAGLGVVAQAAGSLKEGDRVVVNTTHSAGTWATEVVVAPSDVVRVPASFAPELAALLPVGPFVADQMLAALGLKAGDSVALNGEGTVVGRCVALLARARGVTVVTGPASSKGPVPRVGISLLGGTAVSDLAALLGPEGQLLVHVAPSDAAPLLRGPHVAGKRLRVRGFAPRPLPEAEAQEIGDRVAEALKGDKTLAAAVVRHPFAELLEAAAAVGAGAGERQHVLAFP